MKKVIVFGIIVVAAAALIVYVVRQPAAAPSGVTGAPTSTPAGFDQSISDGTITVMFPSADFGLATSQAQVPTHSYIPPCGENFDYCLYYASTTYAGTNFESAGIRIVKRTDLATTTDCLTAQPDGFTGLTPKLTSFPDYAVSVFPNVGDAAAGHFAAGSLYRLAYNGNCYEFEMRVGQSDFYNYPSGTIGQFTTEDQSALQAEMQQILGTVTLPGGERVSFPQG